MRSLIVALLIATALAGCADTPQAVDDDATFDGFEETEVTADTGLIRGVVVDASIVPIVGATVIVDDDAENPFTTNENGAFVINDLEPGFHTLTVDALGYESATTQTDVVAGVEKPDAIRVLLTADPTEIPSVSVLTFNGYLECSISSPAYRVAACSVPNIVAPGTIQEDFMAVYEGNDPTAPWIQAEMLWKSTQPLGNSMTYTMEAACSADGCDVAEQAAGESPLLIVADTETLRAEGQPYAGGLQHRVFNMEMDGTAPPTPVCGIPNPVHGGTMCAKGVGATIQQSFEIYTHVFSNSIPQDGWQFSVDGAPELRDAPE